METLSAIEVNEIRNVQLCRRVKKHTLMEEKNRLMKEKVKISRIENLLEK